MHQRFWNNAVDGAGGLLTLVRKLAAEDSMVEHASLAARRLSSLYYAWEW